METISTLTSVNITNPEGQVDACPRFYIPNSGERFTLEGVTVPGKVYSVAFWVKSKAAGALSLLGDSISTSIAWRRYAVTFTAEGENLELSFTSAGTYYLYHMKLELGNKNTDYTPAPEDLATDEDIYEVRQSIAALDIKADGIFASVKTVEQSAMDAHDAIDKLDEDLVSVSEAVSSLDLKAEGIVASVSQVKKSINSVGDTVTQLEKSVEAKMTSEQVQLSIKNAMSDGVSQVQTSTGFTFNEEGLTVEKSGREMKTQITEDGMSVSRNGNAVLIANNQGVDAENLRATTYLIIGNSRFENYGSARTGCFWIGGN